MCVTGALGGRRSIVMAEGGSGSSPADTGGGGELAGGYVAMKPPAMHMLVLYMVTSDDGIIHRYTLSTFSCLVLCIVAGLALLEVLGDWREYEWYPLRSILAEVFPGLNTHLLKETFEPIATGKHRRPDHRERGMHT